MQTFISFLAKSSLHRELFAIFTAKINDYEDIKVQIAERFCKETLITEISQVSPKRPERAKALYTARHFKAFALTGRQVCVCNNPGRCPGLGASALSGRVGKVS